MFSFLSTSFRDVLCRTQGSFKQQEVCGSIKKSNITNMIALGDRRTYFFNVVREESNDFGSMSETSENFLVRSRTDGSMGRTEHGICRAYCTEGNWYTNFFFIF